MAVTTALDTLSSPDLHIKVDTYQGGLVIIITGRLDSSSSSGIDSYACSLVHSELSWWGLKSSLHLHVGHTHYGSHYSFRYFIIITVSSSLTAQNLTLLFYHATTVADAAVYARTPNRFLLDRAACRLAGWLLPYTSGFLGGMSLPNHRLSWWGLTSSLHIHVAHTNYGSHYSMRYLFTT
jgi:hypothetical protein